MPAINWKSLPRPIQLHLIRRLRERQITAEDLAKLDEWIKTNPIAPEGEWVKDFGSFKLAGEGAYPKTFLLRGQVARGQQIN